MEHLYTTVISDRFHFIAVFLYIVRHHIYTIFAISQVL